MDVLSIITANYHIQLDNSQIKTILTKKRLNIQTHFYTHTHTRTLQQFQAILTGILVTLIYKPRTFLSSNFTQLH